MGWRMNKLARMKRVAVPKTSKRTRGSLRGRGLYPEKASGEPLGEELVELGHLARGEDRSLLA